MNKEKDITAELHGSKEAEVKLLYERGKLITEAKEKKLWEKMKLTKSQYFQGELGITRVEEDLAEDAYVFLGGWTNSFVGLTLGKIKLLIPRLREIWSGSGDDNKKDEAMIKIVESAKNMPHNDFRDWLKGEDDDGKCSPECDWRKEIKISFYCKTHKKRVYTDPRGNFLENFNKQYANSEIKAIKTREEFEALAEKLLSPKETKVLKLRFGWKSYSMMTLEEVAKEIKVTRERIRQITVKAIEKMRWDKDESN